MKRQFFHFLISTMVGISVISCNRSTNEIIPSAEFAPYINAYTGGMISSRSTIKIELSQPLPSVELNADIPEKLFEFSPSIKGKAHWISNKLIEFVPDSGQLKQGELYNATFLLDKVIDVKKELSKFKFTFRVSAQNFTLDIHSIDITSNDIGFATVVGQLDFSDQLPPEKVKELISLKVDQRKITDFEVKASDKANLFILTIPHIKRDENEEKKLIIEVKGKAIGVDKQLEEFVNIPALKPFKVLYAKMEYESNGIEIAFSEPISEEQDLRGFIDIIGFSSLTFQTQDNKVKVFFEGEKSGELSVKIAQGIRSQAGDILAESFSFSINNESLKPAVSISLTGNILPNSKQLLLPFRAVNLKAVDLKVIRIYENNILSFLQSNNLSGDAEIRRFGRLIHKETFRLDSNPSKNLRAWEDYSIDLANIIKQEPGAIYRFELTFKQDYSSYPCDANTEQTASQESADNLTKVSSGKLSEEEEEMWDIPAAYYSGDNIDWSDYKWEERNNPCKPSYFMNQERKTAFNMMASNIGLIVKMGSSKKMWVITNNILDTKPIKEAEIKVYNYQLQLVGSGKTDTEGFAEIDLKGKPFVVVAQQGSQKSYLKVIDGEEKSLSRFDVGGKEVKKGLKGYVYGERGVWRPGDTLHIGFILENTVSTIPNSYPVSLEIFNPKGQFYNKQISSSGLNGFYVFHVPTKADDPTGLWNAYIKAGGATFHKALRIETIQPNRLKINLEIPSNRIDASLGNLPATLTSSWLTGASAGNLKAKIEMSVSQSNTQFKGYDKYLFNNPSNSFTSSKSNVFEGNLNSEGKADFSFKIPQAKNAPGMLQSTIICRVFEPGGNASIFTQTMPFSPFNSYVGINLNQKEGESYMETDTRHRFDIVTLNADGKPINRNNLSYNIYKLNWSWWWESHNESFDSYINNTSIDPVSSGSLNTIGGKASFDFRVNYPEWGRYLVYVKDPESGHATGGIVYVDWPSWRGRSSKSDPNGVTMLAFSTNKISYEIGEEATVFIPASSGGRALIALENGSSLIKKEWFEITGTEGGQYKFKVTEEMAPNFYIHISLLQAHEQTLNDLPIRMYGVVPILVTNKNSHLDPQILMTDVLQPEKEFEVKVKEKQGKAMTYTLAIVDDGLLDLTNFKTPDAWEEFYSRDALGIRTWDIYDQVIGAFGGKYSPLFSIGGDEMGGKPVNQKANRFKPIVKYLGPFALTKGKTNAHKITLPMYVGSVRVMVVAGQDGAYGKSEKTVPVRNPLMVLSTLPRVLSIGEEIQLPVHVFAMENTVKSVSIKVETSKRIQLKANNTKTLHFSKPGDVVTFFDLKTGSLTGVETLKITASSGGQTATETIEIDVRNPNPPIISSQDGLLPSRTEQEFTYQLGGLASENWVKLEVSRIPSVDLNRRFDYLESYEHCCTEQLVSKAFPLLYAGQFKEMTEKESESIKKNVREAIRLLYARQLQSGGFIYWPGQLSPTDWISSYAGHFLCEARQKGFEVNESVINKWKSYQRSVAQNWTYEYSKNKSKYLFYQEDLQQAYRLYTLALTGSPESGSMNRMKEFKTMSQQARWRLAAAYALTGKKNSATELIFNVDPIVKGYELSNDTYGSSYRDEAMILETLTLLGDMKKAFAQAKKVSENLSSENYFNTQTTAYSLLAMGKLSEKIESGMIEMEWTWNGKPQKSIKTTKTISQINIPTTALSGNLKIKNTGKGDLYVVLTSKTKPVQDTLPSIANNLKLSLTYTNLDGKPIDVHKIHQGTDLIASVTISNISGTTNYTDLALTHIIPSGWEIFNERMFSAPDANTPATQAKQQYTFKDIRDDRVLTYFDLDTRASKTFQIRLMAAYAGRYILPAVQCEAMYDTGAQARTKAAWTEVVR